MTAIDVLHRCCSCADENDIPRVTAALADLDALVQAAQNLVRTDHPAAAKALAAALARVLGESA